MEHCNIRSVFNFGLVMFVMDLRFGFANEVVQNIQDMTMGVFMKDISIDNLLLCTRVCTRTLGCDFVNFLETSTKCQLGTLNAYGTYSQESMTVNRNWTFTKIPISNQVIVFEHT